MKNIYKISTGQFVTVWIFGVFAWLWASNDSVSWNPTPFSGFLFWLIPFVLIFYTIGWRNYRKSAKGN
ncbi:MAG TPA: hypothetical protein VMR73_01845 [Candidatus Paceibacterota bacterium]|nr:hypothetical protein [Candidatus Paceibacterota bacterium]